MKYKYLLFDADNTLFDFDGSSHKAFYSFISNLALPPGPDYYAIYQVGNLRMWKLFEQAQVSATDLRWQRFDLFFKAIGYDGDPDKANADYLSYLVDYASLLDGALELLDILKDRGHSLSIITNGLKEVQKPRIAKINLTSYFDSITVSDEIGVAKPHAGFFDVAAGSLGQPNKEEVLVIGDSLSSDIKGGNNYGYDTCWYNPHNKVNDSQLLPKYEINNLSEILEIA